jgi:hypothetical protein
MLAAWPNYLGRSPALRSWLDVALVISLKATLTWWVLWAGLHAISDDDFARIVIAQDFSHTARLDPSGTSWLPFPFWLHGTVMKLAGTEPDVARATSLVLALGGSVLLWVSARWLGASRAGALLGALIAAALPYGLWLGAAPVPDYPTATLLVLAASSALPVAATRLRDGAGTAAAEVSTRRRLLGATALLAATLSRYEAWPIAAGFALLTAVDLWRSRSLTPKNRFALSLAILLALAGPLAWLAHGLLHHGDLFFFVKRVSAYRRALGVTGAPLRALTGVPLSVLRFEPELSAVSLLALLGLVLTSLRRGTRTALDSARALVRAHRRALLLVGLLLLFLVVGELRDGAPTHHSERAVLCVWLWLALFAGDALCSCWSATQLRGRSLLVCSVLGTVAVAALVIRPRWGQREGFVDRRDEVRMGQHARRLLPAGDKLAIHTEDYGYFAVMAGFGGSRNAQALIAHDPRRVAQADPLADAATLRDHLQHRGLGWVVLTGRAVALAPALGAIRDTTWDFLLVQVLAMSTPPPPQGR